ncbi:hypothetical protein [Embleya scabrispora]|uniref:hypothetical protein n=1 Tax=Embleya scabrispora TaxID=159449 RepID=UPI00037BC182|nr:hypothetical protein [Embleya scabrispora]MYS80770.1 hypothetical protein [Streptomyces sp. SID5474]
MTGTPTTPTTTTEPPPLLTYTCETTPQDLIPSDPVGELSLARLRLLVSNPLPDPVRCDRITIVLPVGTIAADLAETGVGIVATATPHTWSVVAIQEDVLIAVPQDGTAEFTRSDHDRQDQVTASLAIQLDGIKLSRKAGTARLRIIESSTTGPGEPDTERLLQIPLTKSRPPRRRRDLPAESASTTTTGDDTHNEPTDTANLSARLTTAPGAPPATLLPGTTPFHLTWQGPTGEHVLYARATPNGTPITFPHRVAALERDETFLVKTTSNGIDRYDSVTVTVDKPLLPGLRVDSLHGAPALTIAGPATTCTATLNVAQATTTDKTCTVTRGVSVTTAITTTALTTTGAITATGTNPKVTAGTLTVTGALQSDDTLDATKGPVSILGNPVVANGSQTTASASTDGFLVGFHTLDQIELRDGTQAWAFDKGYSPTTAALPVHRGDQYSGLCPNPGGTPAHFAFYPIGKP